MMYLMRYHRERAFNLISKELKLYAFAFFILFSINVLKFLFYLYQKTLKDDDFNLGLFLHLEDYYQVFNLLWIGTVLLLKKPIDYILEISLLRSLSTLSIHQRRIKENGKLDKLSKVGDQLMTTSSITTGDNTTNTLAELDFGNDVDYKSESSSYIGSDNNDNFSDY